MIQKFVDRFMANQDALRAKFADEHPSYEGIVRSVLEVVSDPEGYGDEPDPERIHCIDDGDYQGTIVFVIASRGYQPDNYWYVKFGYGSCSGCDTLQAIQYDTFGDEDWDPDKPTEKQIDQYVGVALHVVQGIASMQGTDEEF